MRQFAHFFLLLCVTNVLAQNTTADRDYFSDGKLFLKTPSWENALKIWYQGRTQLDMQGKSDPRLGIAFIELATQKRAARYYGTASEMYLWGFSNFDFEMYATTVKMEVDRLLPLIPEKQHKPWQQALASRDARKIYRLIREFWLLNDPTPTTAGNERLIEHWERIAYARANFRRKLKLPYLTDDRGIVYVKYGPPDRSKVGRMGSSQVELMRLIPNAAARDEIRTYDEHPEYEIWLYDKLDPVRTIFFLFGNAHGSGDFRLVNGVEDLIPEKAFSVYSERMTGIRAGYYLQMVYYDELRVMDSFFNSRYWDMDSDWSQSRGPNKRKLKDQYENYVAQNKFNPVYKYAPPDNSNFDEQFSKITVNTRQARFLDENNQPVLAILAFSTPKIKGGDVEIVNKRVVKVPEFFVKHILIVRDDDLNEIDRQEAGQLAGMENTAIFLVNEFEASSHYVIAAQAISKSAAALDSSRAGAPATQPFFAVGKAILNKPEPLSADPAVLELSDLVLGVDFPPDIDAAELPFPIVPANKVMNTDLLRVYLEVYHLARDDAGQAHYSVEFKIFRRGGNWEESRGVEMIASRFEFDAAGPIAKQNMGIDISRLKRGNYEVVLEVTDTHTGAKKSRSARFSVYEPKK